MVILFSYLCYINLLPKKERVLEDKKAFMLVLRAHFWGVRKMLLFFQAAPHYNCSTHPYPHPQKVEEFLRLIFSYIFQTIGAYLPLVVGRPQWKKATNPKILPIISRVLGCLTLKNHGVSIGFGPWHRRSPQYMQ